VARSRIRGFACCNELYEHLPVVEGFRALRAIGYDAVEVAPYTFGHPVFPRALADAPAARAAAESIGLAVVGLHWLFARTERLHVHHPDAAVRLETRDYFLRCMDLCRALGGEILVMEAPGAIAHVQVNDPNRLGPGMGALEFEPIRDALAEAKYAGWLSVEAFDFTPGPEKIARESLAHLRKVWGHG